MFRLKKINPCYATLTVFHNKFFESVPGFKIRILIRIQKTQRRERHESFATGISFRKIKIASTQILSVTATLQLKPIRKKSFTISFWLVGLPSGSWTFWQFRLSWTISSWLLGLLGLLSGSWTFWLFCLS